MKTYIALLKGINVGGHNKIPMAELRELLSRVCFKNVKTYIQSGNLIFDTEILSRKQIKKEINKAILNRLGFDVKIIVKTRKDLKRIYDGCPFAKAKKIESYFVILSNEPKNELIKSASEKCYEGEEYKIIRDCLYYYSEKGFGRAKFNINFFERKLKTLATARNYKTIVKLIELSS